MSILLGIHADDGSLASEPELRRRAMATARYANSAEAIYVRGGTGMAWQPYGSHPRFRLESGPVTDALGNALSLDGRLDNSRELANLLDLSPETTSDSQIALAAFARWGEASFRKLIGDWAIVAWCEQGSTLYLARDHAGTRTLYYRAEGRELEWATYLDTFFPGAGAPTLSEPYIAAYLAGRQTRELTPYNGVFAVLPGCTVAVRRGAITTQRHWSAFGESELQYSSEQQYDAHFLTLFRQAVDRRTQDGPQVLAELSGGMDSTAIICMSDLCRREGGKPCLLDTVSYVDNEEASLGECRYFSVTETQRGKAGAHLDMTFAHRTFLPHDAARGHYLLPGADSVSILREEEFYERVWSKGYVALLSGIGGDELLGGVPDRYPELAGYLMAGAWGTLARQTLAWSLIERDPFLETLARTVRWVRDNYSGRQETNGPPPWGSPRVRELSEEQKRRAEAGKELLHYTPRQLDNVRTWSSVMETLPHRFPRILARPEYRYPFLDRDLVDFLLRVPRSVLLKPGRRRAMMRRALRGIVPEEILERKRKAYQVRGPLLAFQRNRGHIEKLLADSLLVQGQVVHAEALRSALDDACAGSSLYAPALIRTIALELWLRSSDLGRLPGHVGTGPSLAA